MSFIYNMADTWNAVGTTFNAILMNVSDGAGGAPAGSASSLIMNLQANGTTVFGIDVNGKILGGTGITSSLTLQSTRGVGALTADIIFKVGNNGATEAFRVLNSGNIAIGRAVTIPNGINGKLQVNGTDIFASGGAGGINAIQNICSTTAAGADVGATLGFAGETGNGVTPYTFGAIRAARVGASADGTYTAYLAFYTAVSGGSITEFMRLSGTGGLSVGTTSDPGSGNIYVNTATFLMRNKTTMTDQAGASAGTITNAPSVGNPTKWIAIDDNGTTRKIPTWT